MKRLVLFLAIVSWSAACDVAGEPSSPSWQPPGAPTVIARVTPKRTIEQRNPFGNTAESKNLMIDGDFELTGRMDQMPWVAFGAGGSGTGQTGQQTLNFETGGRCRSGVRCGLLKAGDAVVGFASSPRIERIKVSLWAKPLDGVCGHVQARMIDLDDQAGGSGEQLPSARDRPDAPDESGWCHFEGIAPNMAWGAPVLYVEIDKKATADVLIDDAVALPATPPALGSKGVRSQRAGFEMSQTTRARVSFVAAWLRTHRRYGLPPKELPDSPPPDPRFDR